MTRVSNYKVICGRAGKALFFRKFQLEHKAGCTFVDSEFPRSETKEQRVKDL